MRRGVLLWLLATSAAFLATAGAFLLLANLGAGPGRGSDPIPRAPEAAGPALALRFAEDRLGELERRPDQALALYVENRGDRELADVGVTLDVASEAALEASARRYEENVEGLAPGERRAVEMQVDLSPPAETPEAQDWREILEARATTPGGVSAVETAVLAP
jgi:hypothetical protein